MSTEWIQQRRDELRNVTDTIRVSLDAPRDNSWWCPGCHSQIIKNSEVSIEKHLLLCKLKDIVPNPKNIVSRAVQSNFFDIIYNNLLRPQRYIVKLA